MRHTLGLLPLFALALALGTTLQAQSKLVENLKAGKKQTVVTYGTSLTAGGKWFGPVKEIIDQKFPGQLTYFNGAASGRESRWGLKMLDQNIIAHKPDTVFIEFSINDAVARFKLSTDESRKNMTEMLDRIKKALPNCEIILQITNPVVGKPKGDYSERVNQTAYEQIYRDLAKQRGLLLIDNAPAWQKILKDQGEAAYLKLVTDGVHPTAAAWKEVVVPTVLKTIGLAECGVRNAECGIENQQSRK